MSRSLPLHYMIDSIDLYSLVMPGQSMTMYDIVHQEGESTSKLCPKPKAVVGHKGIAYCTPK
jgi:hypothetical protein